MNELFSFLMILGFGLLVFAQIWLILIIMRGSPFAALLCFVVPVLVFFFISEHWDAARRPVWCWIGGLLMIFIFGSLVSET